MNQATSDSDPTGFTTAFPFHLVIDPALRLRGFGEGIARIDPTIAAGQPVSAHFAIIEPARPLDWSLLAGSPTTVFRFAHQRTGLELRGQVIVPEAGGPAIFLASSWLDDPAELAEFGIAPRIGRSDPAGGAGPQTFEGHPAASTITRCLAESDGTADALIRIADALRTRHDWATTTLWWTDGSDRLRADARGDPDLSTLPAAKRCLGRGTAAVEDEGIAWLATLPIHSGTGTLAVMVCRTRPGTPVDAGAWRQVLSQATGQITQFVVRQNATDRLRRLTSELSAIFQLSPDGFIAFDETGRRSHVNPAFLAMTGFSREDLDGIDEAGLESRLALLCDVGGDLQANLPSALPAVMSATANPSDGAADEGEILRLGRPQPRLLRRSRREARDADGRLFGCVLYFRDITRESALAEQKSEFLSTAAHELRTPLASIHGFAELLLRREFEAPQRRDILETILRQTTRLVDLVNELLDLARIEARAGRDFRIARQALVPVIRSALSELLVRGDPRRVDARLPKAARSSPQVAIDRDKFIQALTNVLSNAYKYSPAGGSIELELCRSVVDGARRIGVRVRDHGIGMSPDDVARLCERFFRADPHGSIPGTGLGMALVREIMTFHGGDVEVRSAPGEGTEVTLWLPTAD